MALPIPPQALVVDALLHVVLPPAVTMAVVLGGGLLLLPKKHVGWLALVGLLLGWWVGNYFRAVVPWWPVETSWTLKYEIQAGNNKRLEWLPWLTTLVGAVGCIGAKRDIWGVVSFALLLTFAVPRIVPSKFSFDPWWLIPVWASVMLFAVNLLQNRHLTAPSIAHPFAILVAVMATGLIGLHAHSARFMDVMVLLATGLAIAVIVAVLSRSDIGLILPPCAFSVVAMVLLLVQETSSEIPWHVFALPGISIATAAIVPSWHRYGPWLRLALVVGICGYALYAAHTHEPLDFENL